MNDLTNPADASRLVQRRWNENGMEELILGLFCSVMGWAYLTSLFAAVPWLPLGVCALGMVLARKIISTKLIFPRTGYVVFRPSRVRMRVLWIFAGIQLAIGLSLVFWASSLPDITIALGPAIALIFAACFVWGAIEYRVTHYYWFAAIALAIGVWCYVERAGAMWVMLGIGIPMVMSGAWHLRAFVKTHPILSGAVHE
jgi:hypothetical protein